jgi:hypothetical protein
MPSSPADETRLNVRGARRHGARARCRRPRSDSRCRGRDLRFQDRLERWVDEPQPAGLAGAHPRVTQRAEGCHRGGPPVPVGERSAVSRDSTAKQAPPAHARSRNPAGDQSPQQEPTEHAARVPRSRESAGASRASGDSPDSSEAAVVRAAHTRVLSASPKRAIESPRWSLLFCGVGGGPAAEQAERLGGSCAGVGGVGEYRQARVEDDFQAFVVELEVADLAVVELLDAR